MTIRAGESSGSVPAEPDRMRGDVSSETRTGDVPPCMYVGTHVFTILSNPHSAWRGDYRSVRLTLSEVAYSEKLGTYVEPNGEQFRALAK